MQHVQYGTSWLPLSFLFWSLHSPQVQLPTETAHVCVKDPLQGSGEPVAQEQKD